ncbi:MAG: hypothetical protein R3336_07195, partial [Phycisphaeraceae bacterium]|nr:hypothetical protein [Phycisphaeraceae bacterium]
MATHSGFRYGSLLTALIAPGLVAAFLIIYLVDREFYLHYILEPYAREQQLVEWITTLSALLGSILLARCTIRLSAPALTEPDRRLPAGMVAVVALAA